MPTPLTIAERISTLSAGETLTMGFAHTRYDVPSLDGGTPFYIHRKNGEITVYRMKYNKAVKVREIPKNVKEYPIPEEMMQMASPF